MLRRLTAAGVAAATVLAASLVTAAPAQAQPTEPPARTESATKIATGLRAIVDLSAQRVLVGDLVAASKYGTDKPIDDPAREQVVLDAAADLAREYGADPAEVVAIFKDQIEASKVVQRGLFRYWDAHPDRAPTERPDLNVIREEINRLNVGIVSSIARAEAERGSLLCGVGLLLADLRVSHERDLDALHARALARSVDSVCG
ncbi:gamma subclass chorismate mutase AroQ [Microlunatus speluncae]|uniref:gamma subclass chorismate mutase AroQ n=1 Tax=Microlunatus speluncae TaxID=2594267 RepID=UPI001C2D5EC4|nr:gamma subclass chorismate mutase AroQ [Microlunatus speluncae]